MTAQHIAHRHPPPAVPAARRRARSAAGRTLPLARPVRSAAQGVVYGLARIDASGHIYYPGRAAPPLRPGGRRPGVLAGLPREDALAVYCLAVVLSVCRDDEAL